MMYLMMFYLFLLLVFQLYLFNTSSHFLTSLLVLESMVLSLLLFSLAFSYPIIEGLSIYVFILTLSVCEAALGLTILISLVKLKSNDMISNYIS
uniref:NADH-ubiquinone oxidoreductase chain 4L n=1 Tax=Zaptyx pinto TaxID=1885709 RepID=A0A224AAL5_9EUPU|nr:NADH dehydrogenase subunit 4L [Zaptyx pinto]